MFYNNDKGIDCIEFTRGHIYNKQKKKIAHSGIHRIQMI